MHTLHLGDLLVKCGALTTQQRDAVLEAQKCRGGPFGALAEQIFGVAPEVIEAAWAEQYAALVPHIDPRTYPVQPRVLDIISRRQAWQFRVLPLELRGRDLIACTTQNALVRALRFAGWRLGHAVQFVLADPVALGEAIARHYPMAGMDARMFLEPV
jgi:hypothetical protein